MAQARCVDIRSLAEELCGSARGVTHVSDVRGSAGALLAAECARLGRPVVYVVTEQESTSAVFDDLLAYLPGSPPVVLPGPEADPYQRVRPDRRWAQLRASSLAAFGGGMARMLLTTSAGFVALTAPPGVLDGASVECQRGSPLALGWLAGRLQEAGYSRVELVEDPATFAIRGELADVWSPEAERPCRVELAFDEVASLRPFDPQSQRSHPGGTLERAVFLPAREAIMSEGALARAQSSLRQLCDEVNMPSSRTRLLLEDVASGRSFFSAFGFLPAYHDLVPLSSHFPEGTLVFFEDGARVVEEVYAVLETAHASASSRGAEPGFPVEKHYLTGDALDRCLCDLQVVSLHGAAILMPQAVGFAALAGGVGPGLGLATHAQGELTTRLFCARKSHGGDLSPLFAALDFERDQGSRIVVTARSHGQADRIAQILGHHGWSVANAGRVDLTTHLWQRPEGDEVLVAQSPLRRGFSTDQGQLFLLTEEEIFGRRQAAGRSSGQKAVREATADLGQLSVGDFVVHREHGIGRYLGLLHREVERVTVDLIAIEYLGGDKLFLPVYRLNQVQRYSGAEAAPRLDRLGGQTFAKTKKQASTKVWQMADQLLALYAARRAVKRPAISAEDDEYLAFSAGFPFEETPDQAAAIADVITDLSSPRVMDRLVCGDVGFGKTEVALRATYLSVLAGRQVALLCPTTILAQQHFRTFESRLTALGVSVRVVSRFQSKMVVTQTLAELKSGTVDVVIGTHRLLSTDVHFKNLGLLVIDEEQRFGVSHKERMRQLRRSVDVLTLTATPIPRTLNLSIGGVRDMSVIMTPPADRRSIRTLLARYDETIIAESIRREVERGGQVYYVRNRVEDIETRALSLRRLLPEVRIGVGHGQMSERELEKTMIAFVEGEFDVLLATTIVESGLDISRANTMIIERADQFGLAQLYQLRGRVGRSSERAYCYLLLPADTPVSDEAMKRLEALERYTALGSGFHIATLDMELRGAGELLGQDQSGLLPRIGFELFSEMLEQAAAELSGHHYVPDIDPEISLDLEALLPETYIEEVGLRLNLYKRFASALSEEEVMRIGAEMEDRFGAPPPEVRAYAQVMRLKTQLRALRVLGCKATARSVTLHLRQDTPVLADRLAPLVAASAGRFALAPDGRLTRRASRDEVFSSGLAHAQQMLSELARLVS